MGLRLEGAAIDRVVAREMITEGVSLGAIQVPPSGQPIILFVEQQTTGGYPKIANVISADLHSVGQLRPRDEIRFQRIEFAEARALLREQESLIQSAGDRRMKFIDLNCDMGELPEHVTGGTQESLLPYLTSVNIACGGHAGDEQMMRATIEQALRHKVAIGAHPGYADRAHFGRRACASHSKETRRFRLRASRRSRASRRRVRSHNRARQNSRRALQPGRARSGNRPRHRHRRRSLA